MWWRRSPSPNAKSPSPQWLLKALGPTCSATRKATAIPWSAQALQEGFAGDQKLFAGASHSHMLMQWVFQRLIRWLICQKGEFKGAWRRDGDRRVAWTLQPLPK